MTLPAARSSPAVPDLWTLALRHQQIDPAALTVAIDEQIRTGDLDFRTRLLIRDCLSALEHVKGQKWVSEWLARSSAAHAEQIRGIALEDLGPAGFPSLSRRIMSYAGPDDALHVFRELGASLGQPATIVVGGSMSLILSKRLSRRTEDIDVVDEIPSEIRDQHQLLADLIARYGLRLAHFQSHYLPTGWDARVKSLGRFGNLTVFLVDELDIAIGKLFSSREKDRDDLRVLAAQIEKQAFIDRLRLAGQAHLGEPALRQNAEKNWYILFGDALPA